jgi:hypothetical protein
VRGEWKEGVSFAGEGDAGEGDAGEGGDVVQCARQESWDEEHREIDPRSKRGQTA